MNILIIEDNPAVSALIRESLDELGHHTQVAGSAADGSRMIEQLDAVDLLVVDFDLGGGQTGAELAARFHHRFSTGSILMITGHADLARQSAPFGPYLRLLSKPFRIAELMLAVERLEPDKFSDHSAA